MNSSTGRSRLLKNRTHSTAASCLNTDADAAESRASSDVSMTAMSHIAMSCNSTVVAAGAICSVRRLLIGHSASSRSESGCAKRFQDEN